MWRVGRVHMKRKPPPARPPSHNHRSIASLAQRPMSGREEDGEQPAASALRFAQTHLFYLHVITVTCLCTVYKGTQNPPSQLLPSCPPLTGRPQIRTREAAENRPPGGTPRARPRGAERLCFGSTQDTLSRNTEAPGGRPGRAAPSASPSRSGSSSPAAVMRQESRPRRTHKEGGRWG